MDAFLHYRSLPVAVLLAVLLVGLGTAEARDVRSKSAARSVCDVTGKKPSVFGIGSSTMYSPLGTMLKQRLAERGVASVAVRAKSASGLARPDYFDWFPVVRAILKDNQPDVFIVSLGGNDGQGLKHGKRWIHIDDPRWKEEFGRRVDELLAKLSGKDRQRAIVWVGPQPAASRRSRGPRRLVNRVIRARVKAFDGPAWFIDVSARTSDDDGKALTHFDEPKSGRRLPLRSKSGAHLTRKGVRWMMLEPVLELFRGCK